MPPVPAQPNTPHFPLCVLRHSLNPALDWLRESSKGAIDPVHSFGSGDRTEGKALPFWLRLLPCSSRGGSPGPSGTVVAVWVCEEDNKLLCLG